MYLGNNLQAAYSSYLLIDSLSASFNGTTTSFALKVNGVAPVPFPLNEQNVLISVGGVPQKPDPTGAEGFKFSGTNIVFSSAPKTGEAFWGVVLAGADYVNVGVTYPDGAAATPSITFNSTKTTGLYLAGSSTLGFTTAGVLRSTIDSNGNLSVLSSGSTTAPSVAVGGGTTYNPGIYSPGTDKLAISTNGSGRLLVDASGNIGVGVTTPGSSPACTNIELAYGSTLSARSNTAAPQFAMMSNAVGDWYASTYKINGYATQYTQQGNDGTHRWYYAASGTAGNTITFTTGMTLDAGGRWYVGTSTDGGAGGLTIYPAGSGAGSAAIGVWNKTNTALEAAALFRVSGATIGSISYSNTAVAYNTTSDYRLKENVIPITDGITRFKQLKPSRFNFIVEPDRTVEGFLAHEAQAVVPECVTGKKDALDAKGNHVYQGIDQSKLVPLLTAALQEAIARIEALEADVAVLKGA